MTALSTIRRQKPQHSWTNQPWVAPAVLFSVGLAMFVIDSFPVIGGVRGGALPYIQVITFPVRAAAREIDRAVAFLYELQRIQGDNQQAQKRIIADEQELKQLAELKAENAYLREQLKVVSEKGDSGILAWVSRYEFNPTAGYVILQLEQPRNLKVGQVVTSGRQIVGYVDELLGDRFVRVQMVNAGSFTKPVVVGEKKRLAQWVSHAGLSITLENVPIESTVSVGDLIQLASGDKLIQKYYLGAVSEVIADDANPLQQIVAKPLVDLYSLDYVIILEEI